MNDWRKIQRPGNEGFSLLEVLIAVVVLAVGLLAIAQMQIISIRFNAQGRDMTEATTLATQTLEYLKGLPFSDPDLDPPGDRTDPNNPVDTQGNPGGRYTRNWNVTDGASGKSVIVVVSWLSGPNRIPRQVQCSTLIANPNP